MRDRPLYISLLCLYLVGANAWALVHSFTTLAKPAMKAQMHAVPLPEPFQVTQYFLAMIVPLITGIFMFEGKNWGRITYLTWGIINFLLAAAFVPDKRNLLPALPIFAVSAIILLLPRPRAYFLLPRHHT